MIFTKEYWDDALAGSLDVVRGLLNDTSRGEDMVFAAATEPLRDFMYASYPVLLGYVALEGPLPLSGQPSGYIYPWQDAPKCKKALCEGAFLIQIVLRLKLKRHDLVANWVELRHLNSHIFIETVYSYFSEANLVFCKPILYWLK